MQRSQTRISILATSKIYCFVVVLEPHGDGKGLVETTDASLEVHQLIAEGEIFISLALDDLNLFKFILALFLLRCGSCGRGPLRCRGGGRRDRGNVHGDRRNGLARGRAGVDGHIGLGRGVRGLGNTENLVNVDVLATLLNLGVVCVEGILVSSVLLPDGIAGVARDDDDGILAVDLSGAKANLLTGNKVAAAFVNDTSVEGTKLVGRGLVGSGNAVTVIACLDGVLASTVSSVGTLEEEGKGSNGKGGFGEHG